MCGYCSSPTNEGLRSGDCSSSISVALQRQMALRVLQNRAEIELPVAATPICNRAHGTYTSFLVFSPSRARGWSINNCKQCALCSVFVQSIVDDAIEAQLFLELGADNVQNYCGGPDESRIFSVSMAWIIPDEYQLCYSWPTVGAAKF